MNKAFIFDMDGVLIDNERAWVEHEKELFPRLFGEEIGHKIGQTTGLGLDAIYERAVALGYKTDREIYLKQWDESAKKIYDSTSLTKDINKLCEYLVSHDFKLGIVSASPLEWINWVIERLDFKDKLEVIISLDERRDLKHKPAPDGYQEAMKLLGATPETTIILEDSNTGIAAAKAAGAYVIGFSGNLVDGYKQEGADVYAKNVEEVLEIVKIH